MEQHRMRTYGVVGEFETPKKLIQAAEKAHAAGYRNMDAYAPFPVEGLSEALGLKRSLVPLVTLTGGLLGGLSAFGFQYWVSVISYPENIGGRSLNSWPAFIPVTFELTVLGASLFAVFGMLAMNKLPQPHHPLFNVERFQKHASVDRFYLCLEATDPKFAVAEATKFLKEIEAQNISEVEDD
jgi:Alternative complex III, ActD subunit